MTERVECEKCGNDEFSVYVDEGRGIYVVLTCTKCAEVQTFGGG